MSNTIGSIVSRMRNTIKAVKSDAFITDRYLYSLTIKYGKALIKRQDTIKKLLRLGPLFRTIPCMELIETNRVEACCAAVGSDCLFKRTNEKVPGVLEGEFGPIFRTISSIDGSIEIYPTTPATYTSMTRTTSFKYNKNKYYWFLNGYLYFPNLQWDAVMVEGIFEDDLLAFTCPEGSGQPNCTLRQEQPSAIPDFLLAEAEGAALKELGIMIEVPPDTIPADKQNIMR